MVARKELVCVVLVACWALTSGIATPRAATNRTLRVDCANGIEATIYPAEYLAERTTFDGTRGTIDVDGRFHLSVITDIEDPLVLNKGDGAFYPFSTDFVIEQLRDIGHPRIDVGIEIFVLPFPRSTLLVSSTSGWQIFLSPQVYAPSAETMAYVVAHEIGHVFQNRYLPLGMLSVWDEYRSLRGIDDPSVFYSSAIHANRPVEIFAEDFRVLYGGEFAHFGGRIENSMLVPPSMVPGLYAFFAQLSVGDVSMPQIVNVNSYPNPFNPTTELHVQLSHAFFSSGDPLSIRIYDVTGALVRELYATRPNGVDVRVQWDGRDSVGRDVASATYFGVVRAGKAMVAQKLSMIK